MDCPFVVGQKVVCVDDRPIFGRKCPLAINRIYTVTGKSKQFGVFGDSTDWFPVISINGVNSIWTNGKPHPWFAASRFRPLIIKQTDISLFTAILNGHRITEDA